MSYVPILRLALATLLSVACAAAGADMRQYHLMEVTFVGPHLTPKDTPARDTSLVVTFQHESGKPALKVRGFWDGDGAGGSEGTAFKVRLTPTKPGRWTITRTESNDAKLHGQHEGMLFDCVETDHPGYWIADHHWYFRSNGSHQFITGNTHYSFLSRRKAGGEKVGGSIIKDIAGNAEHFKKLRFSLVGDRYPDPDLKPFFDDEGRPTDNGRFSHRPNPAWFRQRADAAVDVGFEHDLICDLILCGPDTEDARSTLQDDPTPWLTYVAARYGSYPNVWLCLCNEWDIKKPRYAAEEIRRAGEIVQSVLPYPTPVSVHGDHGDWDTDLNGGWHDHVIIQRKIKQLGKAADAALANHLSGGHKPVVNDENAYEGAGDKFSRADTLEGCLGTILGGGYPTTGEKHGNKLGQYFWGGYDAQQHGAAKNLGYVRRYLDESVRFWEMEPVEIGATMFDQSPEGWRVLANVDEEYLLGSNSAAKRIIKLPPGRWRITQVDAMAMTMTRLADGVEGGEVAFELTTPESRACLTHFVKVR